MTFVAGINIADPLEQLRMCDYLYRQMLEAETDETIDKLKYKIPTLIKLMTYASKQVQLILPSNNDAFNWGEDDMPVVK